MKKNLLRKQGFFHMKIFCGEMSGKTFFNSTALLDQESTIIIKISNWHFSVVANISGSVTRPEKPLSLL